MQSLVAIDQLNKTYSFVSIICIQSSNLIAQIAQSVEQRTENPCVGGSIPPLGTTIPNCYLLIFRLSFNC